MSGDVQPRKRKDKKKKKDDLGIEEPRGTAATLGEGDIFIHSHNEHGTGGHWCAKIIFFSLLAVLVTLIGLIILENRGLSELEANSVESRYSGVLEGWLEDAHDDHHDEHTLELNHHDEDDDHDHDELDHEDDDAHEDDDEHGDDDEYEADNQDDEDDQHSEEDDRLEHDNNDDDNDNDQENDEDEIEENDDSHEVNEDNDDDEEQSLELEDKQDEIEESHYRRYYQKENLANNNNFDNDDDDDDDNDEEIEEIDDNDESVEKDGDDHGLPQDEQEDDDDEDQLDDNDDSEENGDEEDLDNEEEDEHDDQVDEDSEVEVEHIEREVFDDEVSAEATNESEDDKSEEVSKEVPVINEPEEDVEFLEPDESEELPEVMPIPVAKGKPLREVEDSPSTEKPQDTLADEEEYERLQEEIRKEKEQTSQGMWLKLVVGGALLVATQAVLRRATAPREPEDEVDNTREETPLSDRRMTLIAEPVPPPPVTPKPQELSQPVVQTEVAKSTSFLKSAPPPEEEDVEDEEVEEEEEEMITKDVGLVAVEKETDDKELYSDEEEEEEIVKPKKEPPKPIAPIRQLPKSEPLKETPRPAEKKETPKPVEKAPTPEEEYEDDDVEIIEEEDIEEELEEEEDISDVDDSELLNRLEAKYGRLPEPDRPGPKKDGGNSIEDEWPGEPSDTFWRDELDQAERDLRQGAWTAAVHRARQDKLSSSARARYIIARGLDSAAEAKRDNALLTKAIAAYLELLKMNERLSDKKLIEITDRALDRIKFRGNYLSAEPIYKLLIRRYPEDPNHRNNLTVSFLMANRVDLAESVIKETLKLWPNNRVALAHHGFILKTLHNKYEEAVDAFSKALEGDVGPANEPRFYYHLGDSLLLLGRFKEAHEVHKRGAKLGHFLSPSQRSLYNVQRLKSKPWWDVDKTPYARLAQALEKSWKEILKEGQAAQALYEKEKEGLKERGEWSQLDLFVRGVEVPNRCSRAPVTCSIVRSEIAASKCRRGQIKFSSMEAGTHVRPHVGPTNCRLRMHLGLSNTKDTYIRVDQETRQWQTGKVLMFDDSFEHEVWHNGTGTRLVLIVDVWHPDLTQSERRQLPAI